jgi:hypothetical protein
MVLLSNQQIEIAKHIVCVMFDLIPMDYNAYNKYPRGIHD